MTRLVGGWTAPYRCAPPPGRCSSRRTRHRKPQTTHVDGCSCHASQCESRTANGQLVVVHQPKQPTDTRRSCLDPRHRGVLVPRGTRGSLSGHQQTYATIECSSITYNAKWVAHAHIHAHEQTDTHTNGWWWGGPLPPLTCHTFFRDSRGWCPSGSPMTGRWLDPPVAVLYRSLLYMCAPHVIVVAEIGCYTVDMQQAVAT